MRNNESSLYDSSFEHDACGIGFVAHLQGKKSHSIVDDAIIMLQNMEHRGACGCEPDSGDGAGILVQKPHRFFKEKGDIELPEFNEYGVAMIFFPANTKLREECRERFNRAIDKLGLELLGYRQVPTNNQSLGRSAKQVEHRIEQAFIRWKEAHSDDPMTLERRLYVFKHYVLHTVHREVANTVDTFYIASCSYKTIVYKGQLTTFQLRPYYIDLQHPSFDSALALVHSRFSTNTFPKWKLAQPFRFIAHNGEINTIRGNVNWMRSKEALLKSTLFTDGELDMLMPICDSAFSDSANLDLAVELLHMGGRSLPHVMMMLIPEAWQNNELMEESKKAFYEYYASMMEPWDGPASICFTDGDLVGATLDRNGLRPSRYLLTEDQKLVMSSEAGALPVDESKVLLKGRLKPGRMFVADLSEGRIISDKEIKERICSEQPYQDWLNEHRYFLDELPEPLHVNGQDTQPSDSLPVLTRQQAMGYTSEDLKVILVPMVDKAKEPIGSMGADTPLAALSSQSQHIANYFKQLFAQVSNPPIDPIREKLVMSLFTQLGATKNILDETPEHCQQIKLKHPVLTNQELKRIKYLQHPAFNVHVLKAVFPATGKAGVLEKTIEQLVVEAEQAVQDGANILVISDRAFSKEQAPIPSLLATGAVHHHLIRNKLRAKTSLVVEAGDVRETHHLATLIGYGAHAINPYLAFASIADLQQRGLVHSEESPDTLYTAFAKAVNAGLLKIFSKMGISTIQSYHGAQIFEALGISQSVVDKCFAGTVTRIGGVDFDDLAEEVLVRHRLAFPQEATSHSHLETGGVYQWKRRGEYHMLNPQTIHLLQQATRKNDYQLYKQYADIINQRSGQLATLRGLMQFKKRNSVPLEEVEPKESIFKRFATGAMSFGSLSHEAHSTLAIAMNRIGGKSNSGEGGEDEIRFERKPNGDWERSAIKQVASGRFGVTSNYLTNANELQIKMAQGAKPGEGGQLPGHKVDDWIGRVRNATPGVGLISPPPHHDIYSIEDLAQLIYDLKNANREARINVKLVASAGVGTIAAGVAKAHADVVLISGHDGGTGASPLSSVRHAGVAWELGLSETHQTLVKNNLRSRITVQTDGQIKTGRDIAIAILLGAEEFGVSTAALVTEGCIMMRKCHLNTCPVGVATQDPELRALFSGTPEHVINLFTFLAEDLRQIMAELGFRTINEMIGQVDVLEKRSDIDHWKAQKIDLSRILYKPKTAPNVGIYKQQEQDHGIDEVLDWDLIEAAMPALEELEAVQADFRLINTNRSVGTMLSNEVSKKFGSPGLPPGTIHFKFKGSAGQSFAAFTAKGIRFELEGEANDYFGKGLSGSELIIYPHRESKYVPEENMIIGNVAFYGATAGEAYIRGQAGERFCVRNSGVKTVVEGIGDHGCEYMTGGTVVVLGRTGRNFGAGMSGGLAFVYDQEERFSKYCNPEQVDLERMDEGDARTVYAMLQKHIEYTGSIVAQRLLRNWDNIHHHFVKVIPREYKAVLMKKKAQQEVTEEKVKV
ncbi:glutamate synthase large subunit [Tunicatimonas pelagia]|uniref:glutamate synthase large subunit n=1 Tax=Tunicatimonas pelagia TaxID=931531 RepID=UPI00266630FA|nr:glutamate synthase large subunit [Tunicatimonas pelagia]WKN41127.1 glutamate synthase large subunit [Tunicatimonas pelagia]